MPPDSRRAVPRGATSSSMDHLGFACYDDPGLIPYVPENLVESVLGVSVPIFGTDEDTDYRDESLVDFV